MRVGFVSNFVALSFVAFFARAFPARDRFVADFSRVELATVRLRDNCFEGERRDDEREVTFFGDLLTVLLIASIQASRRNRIRRTKLTREINIAALLNQRKNRVCGS